jgi:hypothetical protein
MGKNMGNVWENGGTCSKACRRGVKVDSSEGNSTARVLAIESLGSMWGFLMGVSQFMDGLFHGKSN